MGVPFDGGTSYRPGARFGPGRGAPGLAAPAAVPPRGRRSALRAGPGGRRRGHRLHAVQHRRGGDRRSSAAPTHSWRAAAASSPWVATTRSRCRCCGPRRPATVPWPSSTSTRTSTPGTPTSASATRTARRSGGPGRRASSSGTTACTSACADPLYAETDLTDDTGMGFAQVTTDEWPSSAWPAVVEQMLARVGDAPALRLGRHRRARPGARPGHRHARGGGLTSRELLGLRARPRSGPHRRGRRGRGLARLRPCGDHRGRRLPRALRPRDDHGPPAGLRRPRPPTHLVTVHSQPGNRPRMLRS